MRKSEGIAEGSLLPQKNSFGEEIGLISSREAEKLVEGLKKMGILSRGRKEVLRWGRSRLREGTWS